MHVNGIYNSGGCAQCLSPAAAIHSIITIFMQLKRVNTIINNTYQTQITKSESAM